MGHGVSWKRTAERVLIVVRAVIRALTRAAISVAIVALFVVWVITR
jgi:hypothetical protein